MVSPYGKRDGATVIRGDVATTSVRFFGRRGRHQASDLSLSTARDLEAIRGLLAAFSPGPGVVGARLGAVVGLREVAAQ